MLIDKYINTFHYNEVHKIEISATPKYIYPLLKTVNFYRSKLVKLLFTIRGLPIRMCSVEGFIENGFILLEENNGEEIVIVCE